LLFGYVLAEDGQVTPEMIFEFKAHSAEVFEQCKVSSQIASDDFFRSEERGVVMVNDRPQGAVVEAQRCSKERKELLACSGP
jgi:protein tyrosine phosphatase (PTP) superfamily phosphohydrolase (DUF442 family)